MCKKIIVLPNSALFNEYRFNLLDCKEESSCGTSLPFQKAFQSLSQRYEGIFFSEISTSHQRAKKSIYAHTHAIIFWHKHLDLPVMHSVKSWPFRRSFVVCHFLHAVHFAQAPTCQPATTMSAATIQQLFRSPLSDCLSPPLTLTWTLASKMYSAVWRAPCGYLNVCTERRCPSPTTDSMAFTNTRKHRMWFKLNFRLLKPQFLQIISTLILHLFPFSTVPSFTFTPTGICNMFHLCMPLIFDTFGKSIMKVMMFYSSQTSPLLWRVVTKWCVQFSFFYVEQNVDALLEGLHFIWKINSNTRARKYQFYLCLILNIQSNDERCR